MEGDHKDEGSRKREGCPERPTSAQRGKQRVGVLQESNSKEQKCVCGRPYMVLGQNRAGEGEKEEIEWLQG